MVCGARGSDDDNNGSVFGHRRGVNGRSGGGGGGGGFDIGLGGKEVDDDVVNEAPFNRRFLKSRSLDSIAGSIDTFILNNRFSAVVNQPKRERERESG